MKKLLSLLMTLILTCTVILPTNAEQSAAASEAEEYTCRNFTYHILDDGTAEIIRYAGLDEELMIPDELDGLTVTGIGNEAFSGCFFLTTITIPDSVTSIGEWAFKDCSSLTAITIPDGVTSIGEFFPDCFSLTTISIPDSVTSIGEMAFYSCSSLTDITIPESVTSIGELAFYGCSSLTAITIPDSVTSIGYAAFGYVEECDSLIITVSRGSYAEHYCLENEYHYRYPDALD